MRPWTIVILGALVLSLALPSGADARVRFGPGGVLGAVAGSFGAIFGGYRHSSRHHRRSASRPSVGRRNAAVARIERPAAVGVPPPAESAAHEPMVSPDRPPALFWPDAAADLVEYLFFPNGNDRFWAHGYDTVLGYAVAGSAADDRRGLRSWPAMQNQVSDATTPAKAPHSAADLCSGTSAAAEADAFVERIEQEVVADTSQQDVVGELRTALAQAIERIKAAGSDVTSIRRLS